jgi:hypothetical protein
LQGLLLVSIVVGIVWSLAVAYPSPYIPTGKFGGKRKPQKSKTIKSSQELEQLHINLTQKLGEKSYNLFVKLST